MSRWRLVGWVVVMVVVGGLLSPPFPHGALEAAAMLAMLVGLTIVREVVRLAVGTAIGLRPAIVEIGEGRLLFRFRTGALRWRVGQTAIVSSTIWWPPAAGAPVRARLAVLALARSVATAGIVLGIRAMHVVGIAEAHGAGLVLAAVRNVGEYLLLIGLVPFSLRGAGVVPFESDGLKLSRLLFPKDQRIDQDFARFYFASTREALDDEDPARALAICREGIALYGPPWGEALRAMETLALSRAGDRGAALAAAERTLGRELPPVARALALNNWSWYAFLGRDESSLYLADRRSADAILLKADSPAIAGTRGAVLLWQGRVGEALPLLERGHAGAYSSQAQDVNACLLAMAHAARGEPARAQAYLDSIKRPDRTEGLWPEAARFVRQARAPQPVLSAARGSRTLVLLPDGLELRERSGAARQVPSSDVARVEVGLTARGHARVIVHDERGVWRLPLAPGDLSWARALLGSGLPALGHGEPSVAAAEGAASLETQERAYEERMQGLKSGVSTPKGIAFLASLMAFAASMSMMSSSWRWLGMIVPVLFVHELGHWLAMRAFGHADARISFIPFLGAATMTREPFERRWQEVVMLLAGPVPGIVIGIGMLLSPLRRHAGVHEWAVLLISINAGNLLPLHPLDGGRILHALVTAGRPLLDLAFKTGATLAFLAMGLGTHESILTFLGVFGLLFWGQARRVALLERRIRRTPGFDPRLPPKERRAYVFRALAQEPAQSAKDWASTVAALETPLGYRATPAWQIGLGLVVLAAALTTAGVVGRRAFRHRAARWDCPPVAASLPVSCAEAPAFTGIPWKARAAAPSLQAFVWCTRPDAVGVDVETELEEAELGAAYCQAFPWERPAADSEQVWRNARWTVLQLRHVLGADDAEGLALFDQRVAAARAFPQFDAETARLLREVATSEADQSKDPGSARKALADRLGRSPNQSCDRLRIHNVRRPRRAGQPLSFSVAIKDGSDFGPLGAYLCQVGCGLSVLTAEPDDRRVMFCR